MVTVSYRWGDDSLVDLATQGTQGPAAVASNPAGTHLFSAWTEPSPGGGSSIMARIVHHDGAPVTGTLALGPQPPAPANQFAPSVAGLADGRFVVTYTEGTSVRARVINADGSFGQSIDIAAAPDNGNRSDVTALADGGFAVSWTRWVGGNANIMMSVYNADGSVRHAVDAVNIDVDDTDYSQIAGLAGGSFVVAWVEDTGPDSEVRFRRFDANGNALDGTDITGMPIDTWGDNSDIQIAALPDGGFVVAYADTGFGDGQDINAVIYNANGTARTSSFRVNSAFIGDQVSPTIAVLDNGYSVISWLDQGEQWAQVYDALGNKIGTNKLWLDDVAHGESVGLTGGEIGFVWQRDDPGGSWLQAGRLDLRRDLDGDDSNETIIAKGDGLREYLYGADGHDTLKGGGGADNLTGGEGNDIIDGGAGWDTADFACSLDQYTLQHFGSKIVAIGPDGYDQLFHIENLSVGPVDLAVTDDGHPLFDRLYYLSRNADVLSAGVNPLDHFNAFGRYEGRDPSFYFDTSGYLAVNPDVAAAGINPLDHYHQSGWQEGRDPSRWFDTTLYLLRNPDVAAAGIDPLAHFLQTGHTEGRQAYQAVGQNIVSGFDAQHYLFHNPDVAAAGIDPLTHFNMFGWKEGRDPNGRFDTSGYLAHYTDVAAAGINPLQHYEMIGWTEGRDPSKHFDTLGYLAANPDVAASGMNPLDHFLTFGIYEGRTAVNDGVFF
jgi:hypothetical protein